MLDGRKLAAILAANVVGFTRLASADEDGTLARLRALRSDPRRSDHRCASRSRRQAHRRRKFSSNFVASLTRCAVLSKCKTGCSTLWLTLTLLNSLTIRDSITAPPFRPVPPDFGDRALRRDIHLRLGRWMERITWAALASTIVSLTLVLAFMSRLSLPYYLPTEITMLLGAASFIGVSFVEGVARFSDRLRRSFRSSAREARPAEAEGPGEKSSKPWRGFTFPAILGPNRAPRRDLSRHANKASAANTGHAVPSRMMTSKKRRR